MGNAPDLVCVHVVGDLCRLDIVFNDLCNYVNISVYNTHSQDAMVHCCRLVVGSTCVKSWLNGSQDSKSITIWINSNHTIMKCICTTSSKHHDLSETTRNQRKHVACWDPFSNLEQLSTWTERRIWKEAPRAPTFQIKGCMRTPLLLFKVEDVFTPVVCLTQWDG
jgi:hypothetical protein